MVTVARVDEPETQKLRQSMPVLQSQSLTKLPRSDEQNCSACRLASHCWRKELKTDAVITNILVCRIKREIDLEASWGALLEICWNKVNKIVENLLRGDIYYDDIRERKKEFIREVHAVIYEAMTHYQLGDKTHPLAWLFQPRVGAIARWERKLFQKRGVRRKYAITPYDMSPGIIDDTCTELGHEEVVDEDNVQDQETSAILMEFMTIADDGKTLTTREYRMFRIGLDNLHRPLRKDVDYPEAALKTSMRVINANLAAVTAVVLEASGRLDDVAARIGVSVPQETRTLRKQRQSVTVPLTVREQAIVASRSDADDRELALIFGVEKKMLTQFRKAAQKRTA